MNKHFFLIYACLCNYIYINIHNTNLYYVNKNLFVFWMRLIVWQHYFIVIYLPVGAYFAMWKYADGIAESSNKNGIYCIMLKVKEYATFFMNK